MRSLLLQNFTRLYEDHPCFQAISLSIPPGSLVHISGDNGAGKSTFLRAIAGYDPHEGRLYFGDRALLSTDLQYIGHDVGLYPHLTALTCLNFRASAQGHDTDQLMDHLTYWGLFDLKDAVCHTLSYGQSKRLALAGLRLSTPIWLLDEPLNGLDHQRIPLLKDLCQTYLLHGGIVLMTAHQWGGFLNPSHQLALFA
jgi:heme exporter protein A